MCRQMLKPSNGDIGSANFFHLSHHTFTNLIDIQHLSALVQDPPHTHTKL